GRKSNSRCCAGLSIIIGGLERSFWQPTQYGVRKVSRLRQIHSHFGSIAKAPLNTRSTFWTRKRLTSHGDERCCGLDFGPEAVPTGIGTTRPAEPGLSGRRHPSISRLP